VIYTKNESWNIMRSNDEIILIDQCKGKTIFLNDSASIIYQFIDNRELEEVLDKVSSEYNESKDNLREDVIIMINRFLDEKIIEIT
jgi:Coenzyme PQQ synthesis protein D (PqqD).